VSSLGNSFGRNVAESFGCIRSRRGCLCNTGDIDGRQAPSPVRAETQGAEAGDFATHVNIKALHYLIALAECLNFSRAADRCAVTQPTLSIQVRKLEEYLGVTLFERSRTRVVLTDEGKKVLRLARIVVGAADEILRIRRVRLRDEFAQYAKPTQPRIAVATAPIEEINYPEKTEAQKID
jgi:DNA-binding MarR family transcriptional regulator